MSDESEAALARTDSGLLRAVEAEARRRERIRIGDVLRRELSQVDGHDGKTVIGRMRYGLAAALAAVPLPDYRDGGPWTELAGSVCGDVDGIDVGLNLDPDEPDPWPHRIKVVDGAEDTVAYAYLTDSEVDELIDLLRFARRRHGEWLAERAVHDGPGGGAGG